jgi:hypothetical protein
MLKEAEPAMTKQLLAIAAPKDVLETAMGEHRRSDRIGKSQERRRQAALRLAASAGSFCEGLPFFPPRCRAVNALKRSM